jgi:hypothetical protein
MGTEFGSRTCWQTALRLAAALVLVMAGLGICAAPSQAQDSSAMTPTQSNGGPPMAAVFAQTNPPSQPERSIWSNFHLSGFLNETDGMWINPSNLKQFTPSRNMLATARTWLQADENFRLGSDNEFFMREWFVYEPPYAFDSANDKFSAAGSPGMGVMNDFYNQYTVRDAWWKLTAGPLTLYTGNQIVVWGQSLAFRVGDVINPVDTNWNFGFANLEQSRIPQWMLHPILNLPDLGPLTSNFVEGVFIPGAQPIWNSCNHPDGRYYPSGDRGSECNTAGRVNNGFPGANHAPSARFDAHYTNFASPGRSLSTTGVPFPVNPNGGNILGWPLPRVFYFCSQLQGLFAATHQKNPVAANRQRLCNLAGGPVIIGQWHVPAVQWKNMEEGVRFHTLIGGNEITALYFNTFQYYPIISWSPFTNQFPAVFEPVQYAGMTIDRPIPVPPSLAEYLPLVGRAEAVYQNHAPFGTWSTSGTNPVKYSDIVTWMVALDLDGAYSPWLTTTGNLSANLEFLDQINMDTSNDMIDGPNGALVNEAVQKNDISMLFNIGTSYWWNAIAPTWTMIYQPKGTTFAFFPSIQFNPPWTNKYFARIGLIYVLGSDMNYVGPALFKGQNLLTITGQYNFSAL